MAEYCKQCSIELFGTDYGDFAGIGKKPPAGMVYPVLCEGCGITLVDETGACIDTHCLRRKEVLTQG